MDWQQTVALGIVAVTAALFIRARLGRRATKLPCGGSCGCPVSARPLKERVTYHARKGERPQIIVKLQ